MTDIISSKYWDHPLPPPAGDKIFPPHPNPLPQGERGLEILTFPHKGGKELKALTFFHKGGRNLKL
jgi:hypothetical protein